MQVLEALPVTVDALKQGNMGKLIKQLSKAENPGGHIIVQCCVLDVMWVYVCECIISIGISVCDYRFCTSTHIEVKSLASAILARWMAIFRGQLAAPSGKY